MGARHYRPETFEERLIYWAIVGTWGFWITGTLALLAPVLSWVLGARAVWRLSGLDSRRPHGPPALPIAVVVWLVGMGVMAVDVVLSHIDYGLGTFTTVSTLSNWSRSWAVLALLVLAGATLPIRPGVVIRAMNILGLMTLIILPIAYIAASSGAPDILYTSPFAFLGGIGEFYHLVLVQHEVGSPDLRLCFFSPWAPAAALTAGVSLVFALFDRSLAWKVAGVVSAVGAVYLTHSRLGLIAIPVLALILTLTPKVTKPPVILLLAIMAVSSLLWADYLSAFIDDVTTEFNNSRASSSRVRAYLQQIAIYRWQSEAFFFGHGIIEKGSKLVEYMPIGSHHTWNSLLFLKGIVGYIAFLVPMAWTAVVLVIKSQTDAIARLGLGVMLMILMFSFGENIEALSYVYWPAYVAIGLGLGRRFFNPFSGRLGLKA